MIGEITQQNLYLLLPSKVSRMAGFVQEHSKVSLVDAIKAVYLSDTYKHMEQEETKLWHLGPVDLYRNMTDKNITALKPL
ncbi:MAG: hypothetical protein IKW77_06255 [Salinivirgaceae bacterium]|nr:hypothetical protein [Salinivirgaceae bacterium]